MTNNPLKTFMAHSNALRLTKEEREECRALLLQKMKESAPFLLPKSHTLSLTEEEREQTREFLQRHIQQNPQKDSALLEAKERFFSMPLLFRFSFAFAFVIVFMTGGAYAAESSIPGDILYPVKRYVSEPIVSAVKLTPEERAEWSAILLQRRLREAEAWMAKHPEDSIEMQRDIEEQSQHLNNNVKRLPTTDEAEKVKASVRHELQEKLAAAEKQGGLTDDRFNRIARSVLNSIESDASDSKQESSVSSGPSLLRIKERIKQGTLKAEPLPNTSSSAE